MKKWIARMLWKLIKDSFEIRWRVEPIQNHPEIEIYLAGTRRLLLQARYNSYTNQYDFTEYS